MKNKVVRILVGLLCMVMISSAVQMITIAGAADCSDCDCTTEDGCDGGGGGGSDGASDGGSDDGASDGGSDGASAGGADDGAADGGVSDGASDGGSDDGASDGGVSDGASDGGSDDGASDGGVSCELCKKIRVPIIDCTTKADSGTNCKIVRWEPVGE